MAYVDTVLLNLTEWCCQKFQLLTGRTNVWLAVQLTNLSVVVYFVWAGLYSWSRGIVELIIVALFCAGLMYVLTQTIFAVSIEAAEIAAYQRVARGFRNPRRLRDAPLRIAFLTLSVMLSYPVYFVYVNLRVELVLLTYSLIVLTTAVLYVLACDPLPPCVGKVRQWLRGAVPSRSVSSSVAGSRSVRRPCRAVAGPLGVDPLRHGRPWSPPRRSRSPGDVDLDAVRMPGHRPDRQHCRHSHVSP